MSSLQSSVQSARPTAARGRKNPAPQRFPVVDRLMPVAVKTTGLPATGGVEATALLLSELSLEPSFTRSGNGTHSTFANLARNGLRLAIKLRNAPVTVSPHHDIFNNFCMDVKLPNDFQGNNLKHLEEAVSDGGTGMPTISALLARLNGEFTFKSRLYGSGENTFLSLKLQENLKVVRKATDGSITPATSDDIVRGMEVDLALSPLLWISEPEDGPATVGVSYKVGKIQITEQVGRSGTTEQEIDIELCKRCGMSDHKNATSKLCLLSPKAIKIRGWEPHMLDHCPITEASIAGFFDGDGSISFTGTTSIWIVLEQSHSFGLEALRKVRSVAGGVIKKRSDDCYRLHWSPAESESILTIVAEHGVVKAECAQRALRFLHGDGGGFEDYRSIYDFTSAPVPKVAFEHWLNLENINEEWLGGFFAAEGSLSKANGCWHLRFTQKSHPAVLEAIQNFFEFGSVDQQAWRCYSENAVTVALMIGDYALHKQLDLLQLI